MSHADDLDLGVIGLRSAIDERTAEVTHPDAVIVAWVRCLACTRAFLNALRVCPWCQCPTGDSR